MSSAATVHASAVLLGEGGILIRGPSGSGKSSLVLSLLWDDEAALVADDRVELAARNGRLVATAPEAIAGMLEVRGQSIARRPWVSPVVIDLVADLMPARDCPRLPGAGAESVTIAGAVVPRVFVAIGAADAAPRLRQALDRVRSENH